MKPNFLIALSLLFMLTSCSINDDNGGNQNQDTILVTWHLISTTGGIAGVDDPFPLDTIVWFFDEINDTVIIENNNTDDTKQDLLDSGTYSFSISTIDEENFIFIDTIEYGQITIETSLFTINENNNTTGQTADGFLYTFQRVETVL